MDMWVEISLIVGFISLFIAIILHMVANAFNLQNLRMWVKGEYVQVFVTFLIIMVAATIQLLNTNLFAPLATSIAAASGNLHLASTVPPNTLLPPSEIGKAYILVVIRCQINVYTLAYTLNAWVEPWSTLTYDIRGLEPISGGFALTGYVAVFHYIANNMIYLILFHYIQYYLLHFAHYTMLYPFLPIGLVLRSFPLTRGIGGFVTAFALGFAFVFPLSYVMIISIMPSSSDMCREIENIQASQTIQQLSSEEPCFTDAGNQFEIYYKLNSKATQSSAEGAGLVTWISDQIDYIIASVGIIFLQAMFYPLVSLIITFTFIRQTSSLLGADLAEIGRGLIKII
ncbi:MAG: hypothetical protein N3G80_00695 [Candidatus Micrarchaeota archaeon]|nr:hypothetical protein [Candidatus Micrarchaeota archaeon]